MAIKNIIIEPNKILRQISQPVESVGREEQKLMDDMLETMYSAKGIGLAAIQIGVPKRIIVMDIFKDEKKKNQPTKIKTSGSTFKNPLDQSTKKVWQLIKESVSLEKSFGDACISEKHCNFFVNKGNAKFEDMKKLIEFVSESVLKKTGVKLETEIKILE